MAFATFIVTTTLPTPACSKKTKSRAPMSDTLPITRALISVSDKTGVVEFARALAGHGIELLSTGGTSSLLREAGLEVRDVADLTGFPEIMDGRVKTLHPKVHGGLLARRDLDADQAAMAEHGIAPIDLLVVNLYPFEATVRAGADYATTVENIDIGGPAMIRAAAKNHKYVSVVVDPEDYDDLAVHLAENAGGTTQEMRNRLAATAYARTAAYDAAVSGWLAAEQEDHLPRRATKAGQRVQALRYGENPHQTAAFYSDGSNRPGVATARQVQGKELSYNNINDTDAAFELVAEFDPKQGPVCAIIKHANPSGVATGDTLLDAYRGAFDCDRTSAFGGIVATNQPIDAATAEAIVETFTEVVIAPEYHKGALSVFERKPNLRVMATGGLPDATQRGTVIRPVGGGFLLQDRDTGVLDDSDLTVVTKRAPSARERADLLFAWRVAKHVKSNALVYARDGATVGIGAGQMSRLDSSIIAGLKARRAADAMGLETSLAEGSVVASDAFFPFADGLLAAAESGATAIIQPGGSMRDAEVIEAADEAGLAMVFTGMRHFRH